MSESIKFDDELQRSIHADPFVPFSLLFTSGDRFKVSDPGMAFSNDTVVIIFQPKSGMSYFRKNQIVGIEMLAGRARPRRRRSRRD